MNRYRASVIAKTGDQMSLVTSANNIVEALDIFSKNRPKTDEIISIVKIKDA